ncbi:MAG: WYL domain-containing protein [Bacteroidetes bacterium]|nr:WYL domain-containing protein [Bacteroidota bacterium]
MLIIKKLRIKPYSSYEEIEAYISNQLEFLSVQDEELYVGFSKRTLQRDIREIRSVFGLIIEYSTKDKGYHIVEDIAGNMSFQKIIEAFDLFSSLNMAGHVSGYIHFEDRKRAGTENILGLLHAIKSKLVVTFNYEKYWDGNSRTRELRPLLLKEFKNRWYVIGEDENLEVKTFALDRMTELTITSKRFKSSKSDYVKNMHFHAFGIIAPTDAKPEKVEISLNPIQGKYVKSLPLHRSQKILVDNDEELRISLIVYITWDLIMELLSYGETIKILEPQSLVTQVKNELETTLLKYK